MLFSPDSRRAMRVQNADLSKLTPTKARPTAIGVFCDGDLISNFCDKQYD
jgi:hypothetical protein